MPLLPNDGAADPLYWPRCAGSTPANARKSTILKSPVTPPLLVGKVGRQLRSGEVGVTVELQERDEGLADDPTADGPEGQAVGHDLGFPQDVGLQMASLFLDPEKKQSIHSQFCKDL